MQVRLLSGLALVGYGLLVIVGLVAHEAQWLGWLSLAIGVALLVTGRAEAPSRPGRPWLVRAIGLTCLAGIVGYNAIMDSGYGVPEKAIFVYGALLVLAAGHLDRRIGRFYIGTLVAWSFPLLLAPLSLFAIDAALMRRTQLVGPIVHALVVLPTAWSLDVLGTSTQVVGNALVLQTDRGTLVLGIGLVCAGLYPMVLFGGMLALQAWQTQTAWPVVLRRLGAGILGLWALNIVRLLVLVEVGRRHGGATLQSWHAHLGWILFAGFMVAYWWITGRNQAPAPAAPT